MTAEHKDLDYLKGKFEDGDRPTGEDFARLIDSCHNTRQLTDVTVTGALSVQGGLTVDGTVNTRDVAADGAKLDNLDSFVRDNSDSWEETDHILTVSSTVDTVSSVLSNSIYTLNSTLSTYIDNSISTVDSKIDSNVAQLTTSIDNNTNTIETNADNINTRVDNVNIELDELETDLNALNTTVADNSASWGVDENTNTLGGLVDVVTTGAEHNSVLKYDTTEQLWLPATDLHGEGQHVDTFLELHDTPVAYTGADEFIKVNQNGDGLAFVSHDTQSWDNVSSVVKTNSASWAEQTDVTNLTNTVATNSASWAEQTDVTNLTNTVATNSASWAEQTDVTDLTTNFNNISNTVTTNSASWAEQTDVTNLTNTVATNSASWGDHTDITDVTSNLSQVTNIVATNSASWAEQTDITDVTSNLSQVSNTVATNSASWAEQTDITDVTSNLSQVTNTVATNSASWAEQTDITDVTSNLSQVSNTVATNSASWAEQTDITDVTSNLSQVTNTVATNSASWAVLDSQGKLVESQIPELSITQTYTVQNAEDVALLNPAEGLQRGDIVIVTSMYDNLIAKQDNPAGTYDSTTKTYSGYSKLARPAAYVTSVNDMYGNVTLETDNISDVDNTNKWTTQQDIDRWNTSVSVTGDVMTGDLDTSATYLSGGTPLHDIFSTNATVNGDSTVTGTLNAGSVSSDNFITSGQPGITQDVNIGGHVLRIVNGLIVGITDE